jgi:hypothetical protein
MRSLIVSAIHIRLRFRRFRVVENDGAAVRQYGNKILFDAVLIVSDQGVGHGHDLRRRPVVSIIMIVRTLGKS